MSIPEPVYDSTMHDPLGRKVALFILLVFAIGQTAPRVCAGSLAVDLVSPSDGAALVSTPVNLKVVFTDGVGPVQGVPTKFYIRMPGADHFGPLGTVYSDAQGYSSKDFGPPVPGAYEWYVNYTDTGQELRYPSSGITWTFGYTIPATTTSTVTTTSISTSTRIATTTSTTTMTVTSTATSSTTIPAGTTTQWSTTTSYATIPMGTTTQWITTAYTRTVGIVTESSYIYATATSRTTSYITRTVSTTKTTSRPSTLTKTTTAFATTETTPMTYYETQSMTLTETSYATISLTQYVYVESYNQGQVLENATIQQIPSESEASAHFDAGDKHDIQTITIGVINNATNVKITIVTAPQRSDVGMDTNEYGSFEILATNLSDDNIKSVVIEFKVDKNWLSRNQIPQDRINLYRYENGEWRKLETSALRTDDAYAYYKATSPGLSIFAIAGQSSSFLQLPGIGAISDSYVIIFAVVVVAILGAYAAIRVVKTRSKRGKEEKKSEPMPSEVSPQDQTEKRLLDYITQHSGSISLKKASEDLGVPSETIKEAISQLKSSGKLAPA